MSDGRTRMSSNLAYILVSIGGAVGMGNLWRFPFYLTSYGGSIFLIVYLGLIFFFGIPLVLAETAIGRRAQTDPTLCYQAIYENETGKKNKLMRIAGFIPLITIMVIFGYYNVVAGWAMQYVVKSATVPLETMNVDMFNQINYNIGTNYFFTTLALVITAVVVWFGVNDGIEKMNKFMIPCLFVMLLILVVKGMTLPTASQALEYLLTPDMRNVDAAGGIGVVIIRALGAAFGSLNLGFGTYMTFGSYLSKKENIVKSSIIIPLSDTLVAFLAAFAIIPVIFSLGQEPGLGGAGTMFGTLPLGFATMGGIGKVFCTMFFILVSFAALTSLFPCLEVGICWLNDNYNISRKKANIIICLGIFVFSTLCVMGYGPMANITFFGYDFFNFWMLVGDFLLPISALSIAIVSGWIMKKESAFDEVTSGGEYSFPIFEIWRFLVRYVAPIGIVIMLIITIMSYI